MKKILLPLGFIVVAAMIFYSCKKDHIEVPNSVTYDGYSVKNGRLAFNSVDDYEDFLSDPQSTSSSPNGRIAFKTAKKSSGDTLIEDDFLADLLNEKNEIEIGGKLYKLDFAEEKVYVLSEINDSNLVLLENKDLSTGKIKVYTMDDEVLYMYDENLTNSTPLKLFCNGHGAPPAKADNRTNGGHGPWPVIKDVTFEGVEGYQTKAEAKHVYQKAGILFSLVSKMQYFSKPESFLLYSNADTRYEGTFAFKYETKCGSSDQNPSYPVSVDCDFKMVFRPYLSGRALKKYLLDSDMSCSISGCGWTNNGVYNTVLTEIKYGY